MSNQNAIKDDNTNFSLLVADSTGVETRQLRQTASGGIPTDLATLMAGEDLLNNVTGVILKPLSSAFYAPASYKNAGAVTKANIKASSGSVFSIRVTNANASARYFQLHNKATAPAATDAAQQSWLIPAGTAAAPGILQLSTSDFSPSEYFATGIGFAISTTDTIFTDSASASDHTAHVRYV